MPDLPTGAVTFLFTDIEGSTKLLEHFPRAYPAALARHEAILREVVATHGGVVFETVGDAVYAAFGRAGDALAAALEAQVALHAEAWGEVGGIRVRIGLHTGDVERRGGHYFGAALYRCARLTATAHGGQTLLSGVTAGMVMGALPQDTRLRSLGWHRLKDLGQPEHVFQMEHPRLPSQFPPLRSVENRPNNLPFQATPLIGRQQTIEAVTARLGREDVRLLTLTGPGVVGKTRLALQVAADVLHQFEDGVFFVSLAALHDPPLVGPTVAQTLGIREVGGRPVLQDLKEHLREKQMLLVLDNFEQVLDAAPLLPELLATCVRLKLLVTSRAVLHVYGEHEVPVAPLDVPTAADLPWPDRLGGCPSVLLFIERARALVPDFELSAENALPVADICLRLEGLPLAVELAAARAKLLPPRAMLPGLQSRLSLLTGGPRDVPARQQTLRATIAWSCSPLRSRRSSAGSRSSSVAGHLKRRRPSVESCPSWRARRC